MKYLQVLYDEHEVIMSVVDIAECSEVLLNNDIDKWKELCNKLIYFFRNYADQYHHNKEEQYLFPTISDANEVMGMNIVAEMLENHQDFRDNLAEIEDKLSSSPKEAFGLLIEYCNNLSDHIAAENEELFIAAETLLSDHELETMMFSFQDIDRDLGSDQKDELQNSINDLLEYL